MDNYKDKNIIVVDDEPMLLSSLKMLFELEGFTNVQFFESPVAALEVIKTCVPDLIISDFMMPEMNGFQFLTKAKKYCPDTSMILLTGYADKENAIRAINEVGIYKYIEKPWDNEDLLISVRNGIERSSLINQLNQKVVELSEAKAQLEKYSHSLEGIVLQKTADLVESNTKLSAIINYCADGIVIVSPESKILQANPAFENLTGLDKNLLVGKSLQDIIISGDNKIQKITNDKKEVFLWDAAIKNCINDKSIPVEINFAPIPVDGKDDSSINYVGVVRNVSLQKEMDRLRDDFIATLTHDLRTPLLAAIQTLQFFLDGTLGDVTERQSVLLDTMKKSNEDMLGLVNALLEVYKYEAGKLNLCKTTFSLSSFIDDCVAQVRPLALKKGINLSVVYNDSQSVQMTADRNELRRVLLNLCGNALNHTPENGNIELSSLNKDGDLILNVKDDGIGIPKTDITKLFKRFSQGTSQKRSAGTGLGLYLSRQIVEAHGGKIWAESEVSKGSVFSILIPKSLNVKEQV